MSTQFKPIEIPPGVVAKATKKQASSNWSEVNLVRWIEGQLAPIGGQSKYVYEFASRAKKVHAWYGLDGVQRFAYLCETNIYVDVGGELIDITPVDGMLAPPPPGEGGYGDGEYGEDAYGTERPLGPDQAIDRLPAAYSLSNFGGVLLAMTSADSRLLVWDPLIVGVAAEAVATVGSIVPRGRCFVVTPERFVMILGSYNDGTADDGLGGGDFRRISWCDQEDYTVWTYTDPVSQAGFIDIEPASPIVCALATRTGVLIWTGKKAYRSRFLAAPYIYDYEELADNCTPWSPQSMATTSAMALWFSQQGVYSYDGTSILPVQCPIRPWIDDDIDMLVVRDTGCGIHVENFNEFWWFFPQQGKFKNTRVGVYNYKDGWWAQGRMSRSAGMTASYTSHTIMADEYVAYEHESESTNFYGAAETPWAETFDLNVNSGGVLTTVKQLMPDIEGAIANVLYSLFYRRSRSLGDPEVRTPYKTVRKDGYVDFRTTGRDIRLRIDFAVPIGVNLPGLPPGTGAVYPVTVGQHLIDAVPRGDR